ncbi:MAG TPA: LysR family transcriptional regulator, partial [Pirellulales bacterium]
LIAISDSGSMAKAAAAKLGISHPAISKTISEIEATLGVRLLDRGSQGTELTAHGEILRRCGINIFDEMQQGLRSLDHLSDPNSGEVRLGCTDIILNSLVPPMVRKFAKQFPRVQLDVKLANPGEHQVQQLRGRNIDLLMTRATAPQDDFISETLFEEPFVFVVGKKSKYARRARTLKDIMDCNWVLPPYNSAPGALVAAVFQANDLSPPRPIVKTIAIQFTVSLIASGEFVGILPKSVAELGAHQAALQTLPLKSTGPRISAEIVFLKNRTLSPAVLAFIDSARQVTKMLVQRS